jgi:hypothetical protein
VKLHDPDEPAPIPDGWLDQLAAWLQGRAEGSLSFCDPVCGWFSD